MESIKRICRYCYYRFIRLPASPENLARGVALGFFISTTPTFGIQTIIALFLAALFRVNKLAAVPLRQLPCLRKRHGVERPKAHVLCRSMTAVSEYS